MLSLAACGGSGSASPSPSTAPLTIQPTTLSFGSQTLPQQTITVQNVAPGTPLSVAVGDATLVGATAPSVSGTSATFTVYGIARGSTTVTVTGGGMSAALSTQSVACGRPEPMTPSPVLLSPTNGATGVSPNVGSLYFGVYSAVPSVTPYLHLIVGTNGTLEAGALSASALPSGTPTAPPQNGATLTYMRATVPPLGSSTTYHTELYDDGCQSAQVVGSFST